MFQIRGINSFLILWYTKLSHSKYVTKLTSKVRQYINYLHDRFVIVPVDKAGNNFGIVCKSFYLDVIKMN